MTHNKATVVTLEGALAAHQQWKATLQNAVRSGQRLDVATIRRDDCCELGKWLHADGRSRYGHRPEFTHLLDVHNEFHLVTSVVANIINGKEYEQARAMLGASSQFSAASTDVALAILRLKAIVQAAATAQQSAGAA